MQSSGYIRIRRATFLGYGTISRNMIRRHAAIYEEDGVVSSQTVRHIILFYIHYLLFASVLGWGNICPSL